MRRVRTRATGSHGPRPHRKILMCPGCKKRAPLVLSGTLPAEKLADEIKKALKDHGVAIEDHAPVFACNYCDCVTDSDKRRVLGYLHGARFTPA